MKIVMLSPLFDPHIGGVEKHVKNISKEMIKDGHEVHVFTLKHDETLPTYEVIDEIEVHRKPTQLHSRILKHVLFFLPKNLAAKIVERDEIWGWLTWNIWTFLTADVIHIHDVFFWYWPLRIFLFWKPVYITFHGFEPLSVKTSKGQGQISISSKAKHARKLAEKFTNGNICVGAWIEKWYGTKPTLVTYGAGACISTTQKSQHKTSKIKCVFIGRVADDTGAHIYKKVIDSLSHVTLDIFGKGSSQGMIDDSCTVFPKYDIACVSSYLSIVEAMQSRVLVVAFAVDDLKYDYLMSHPMNDSMIIIRREEQLVSFLETFNPEHYAKERERAYTWAKEQTWENVAKQYYALWENSVTTS